MTILIIDDEPLARDLVKGYLAGEPGITLLGECENGFEALKMIQDLRPDLIFLDIQMPKINGFELLEVLDNRPQVIFTTAFDEYAIRAFEMNAVDYLLKPFSKERLQQALARVRSNKTSSQGTESLDQLRSHLDREKGPVGRVVTRLGSKITVIPVEKIWYIESADDYVMITSELGRHLKEKTMKYFEENLPENDFIRIHRSYIINLSQIASVELYEKETHLVVMKNGAKLRASTEGYKRLRERF